MLSRQDLIGNIIRMLSYLKESRVEVSTSDELYSDKERRECKGYTLTVDGKQSYNACNISGHNGDSYSDFNKKDIDIPLESLLHMNETLFPKCERIAREDILRSLTAASLHESGIKKF